ncbi:hypothetical protein N7541_002545 [Penicillium brevicompactum]|uniref:Uncharacterized protein n=1 Tax=Penicillium brevicompactum TaxID=5074 RepID=A0A9W9RKI0_PENBR|nr:hypothetical protein N7541_002545 [Penicillium brevicompactum]
MTFTPSKAMYNASMLHIRVPSSHIEWNIPSHHDSQKFVPIFAYPVGHALNATVVDVMTAPWMSLEAV